MPKYKAIPAYYSERKYKCPDKLQTAVDKYFKNPVHKIKKISSDGTVVEVPVLTISGLAYSLGFCSRKSLYDYIARKDTPINIKLSTVISRAVFFIEGNYEGLLQTNNTAGIIFALKNMGWRDRTEIVEEHKFNLGDIDVSDLSKEDMFNVMLGKLTVAQIKARKAKKR